MTRLHTRPEADVFDGVSLFAVVDEAEYLVPAAWDKAAADLLIEKVFCRLPLPAETVPVPDPSVPPFFWRHAAVPGAPLIDRAERDIRAVLHRLAGSWAYAAWKAGVFDSGEDARAFYDEARHLLLHRLAAPEIAIWAEAGLDWAYGLPARKINFSHATPPPVPAAQALRHLDLRARQAALDGGKIAAVLGVDNADAENFIRWKARSEAEALARGLGLRALSALLGRVMDACDRDDAAGGFSLETNLALARAAAEARRAGVSAAAIESAILYARQGFEDIPLPQAEDEPESVAQAATAILSLPDTFIESALTGHGFAQADGRRVSAEKLWDALAESVWAAGAPRVFFSDSASPGLFPSADGALIAAPGLSAPSAALDAGKLTPSALEHAAGLMTVALDAMAEAPSRPVVLGVANVARALENLGLSYDSDGGRATAALIAALVTGAAHRASAALAAGAGAFGGYAEGSKRSLKTLHDRLAVFSAGGWMQKGMLRHPVRVRAALCPDKVLASRAQDVLARAYVEARGSGLRNAHLTGIGMEHETQVLLGAASNGLAPAGDAAPEARLKMQAAVEPLLCGAAAQTIPLPRGASVEDVQRLILRAWELGVKAASVTRDAASVLHAVAPAETHGEEIVPENHGRFHAPPPEKRGKRR